MPVKAPDILIPHLARPVAILGAGASGRGAQALAGAMGASSVTYDEAGVRFTAAAAFGHSLAVFSPGFRPDHPWLAAARACGCLCLGELDFASLAWRGRIVAVTGTNGKTTLTEFLVHALGAAGFTAAATGNIGRAFSQVAAERDGGAPGTIAVCEVSSFQAETLAHLRPEAVLWTNFAEDHLERHPGMDAYFRAKARLAGRAPRVFAGSSVRAFADRLAPAAPWGGAPENTLWVASEGRAPDPGLSGTVFSGYPQYENFLIAAAWWESAGLDPAALRAAARTFRLGRHRLARVATIDGVAYWNDSKATNFHSVEAALARFGEPVVLIAGGRAKGCDCAGFVRRIAPRVAYACLIGETAAELALHCGAAGIEHARCATLDEAITRAAAAAPRGGNVLLSPGFASFDLFSGYEDRGDQFEKALQARADSGNLLQTLP